MTCRSELSHVIDAALCSGNIGQKKSATPRGRAFLFSGPDYFPIFTSVTSKIRVAFGGKPFFGSEP